jgi:hypothetical protein
LLPLPFLAVAALFAYFLIFSRFMPYDDDGYLMISVRSFLEGHPLYDVVFTQYGPFYYLYQWLFHRATSLPVTHDVTRLLTVCHWLAAASLLGAAIGRLTRSLVAGLFTFMQGVVHLVWLANEPGHPQELVAVLLGAGLLAAAGPGRASRWVALGAIGAALALTKINAGALFCLPLLLALLTQAAVRLGHRVWPGLVLAACGALPALLMRHHLDKTWGRNFCVLLTVAVVMAGLAALTLARKLKGEPRPDELAHHGFKGLQPWLWIGGGFVVLSAAAVAVVLASGTSLWALADGLLVAPARFPQLFWGGLLPPNATLLNAALSLCAGLLLVMRAARPTAVLGLVALAKAVYGGLGALVLVFRMDPQLYYLLPWTWLVLAPGARDGDEGSRDGFARVFLGLTAAWQGLQAYPVAGTQVAVGTFLLVAVFTLCLHDALRELAGLGWFQARRAQLSSRTRGLLRALVVTGLLALFALGWCRPHVWRQYYAGLEPSGLRGAQRLRLPDGEARVFQDLVRYLDAECDTFVTFPGVNSLHFWAGRPPPSHFNTTGWMVLLSDDQQRQTVQALRRARRPLVVINVPGVSGWKRTLDFESRPLVRHIREEYEEVARFGYFQVLAPKRVAPER